MSCRWICTSLRPVNKWGQTPFLYDVLMSLGFSQHTRGSHHIFSHPDVLELINLQRDGGKAKPYQVRQVRAIILQYKLGADE
ncbi:MAG: type II toxin-antitoxin system HicA family toxin [Gammaproteobacteria bacterium]|nr:type II toxin-antitoxin system HicA family toxin [Gammaproteobacteria bacterium]MBU1407450.1 type II toxin-antitoxin system HicA family toxin [Gammaproteobacteria bacterium]MBU1531563.1 type II toxin-antitoxin system HicA family toxin [Gammaproteobacteria bacterium]